MRQPKHRALNRAELMAAAQTQTGVSDFGDDDFVEPLERLMESIETEGNLTPIGLEGFKDEVLRLLVNRLRIQADVKAHPEILEEDVSDPIMITGLPRTGTTKLQKALAAPPDFQKLPLWKALNPARQGPVVDDKDPRLTFAEVQSEMLAQYAPDFMAGHPQLPQEPEEEALLLFLSFRSPGYGWFFRAPSYYEWVMQADLTPAYADLHQALQYLQWQDGGRRGRPWVLKSPAHLGALDCLLAAFPNATVVHCHRDIDQAVPSLARLLEVLQLARGIENVDCEEMGRFLSSTLPELWRRNVAQREALPQSQILDVSYESILQDLESVLIEIFSRRAGSLDAVTLKSMVAWEGANPQHKYGRHLYTLERYGLTSERIRADFADYLAKFARLTNA